MKRRNPIQSHTLYVTSDPLVRSYGLITDLAEAEALSADGYDDEDEQVRVTQVLEARSGTRARRT